MRKLTLLDNVTGFQNCTITKSTLLETALSGVSLYHDKTVVLTSTASSIHRFVNFQGFSVVPVPQGAAKWWFVEV